MAGSSTFTSTDLSVTNFDATTTATGSFIDLNDWTNNGGTGAFFQLPDNSFGNLDYFAWNWGASTDADPGIAPPNTIVSPSNNQVIDQIGIDDWSMTITFTQYGIGSATGDSIKSNGVTILTFSGTLDGDSDFVIITGSGANSLAAAFRQLSIGIDPFLDDGSEQFGISFAISDTTPGHTGSVIPTFTEAFSLLPCFVAGTRIGTPGGQTAIEVLAIGDLVSTSSGIAKPVKWIGRRSYDAALVAANAHLRPVVIRKDALGSDLPSRDLAVSAMHALFIDDVFIPAASLVNSVTILRSEASETVDYIHIELDDHDVIFAEGAATETFVDDASRLMFDNADEYYDIYGADEALRGFSAPRIEEGYQLEALRRGLAGRAGVAVSVAGEVMLRGHVERIEDGQVHGWVMDAANPGSPVELEIIVEGEMVARVLANRYRADLDHAGLAGGSCAFTVALPASVTGLGQVDVRHSASGVALAKPRVVELVD